MRIASRRVRLLTWSTVGIGLTGLAVYSHEPSRKAVRHTYLAGQRISTVTRACFGCFRKYYKTLNAQYPSEDEYEQALSKCHKECAQITLKAIEKNAGIFIKLGQHFSALTYMFPREWTETMIPLQDRCPRSSLEDIDEMIKKDTDGQSLSSLFSEFDPEPLGTASLAQVHRAVLRNTEQEVAVKVQHPSLQEFVPLDVLMTRVVFSLMDYFFPQYPLTWLGDELQTSIYVELDFREEAKNALATQHYFRKFYNKTALRIPDVLWAKQRILVMEYVRGGRIDDEKFLAQHNISPADVSACLAHTFNNMIFTPNVGLHCDPHPGNLAIIPRSSESPRSSFALGTTHNFEIVLYDHGLYRQVPTDTRRSYAHFWLALLDGDEPSMRKYAKEFAGIDESQFMLFAAAITGRDYEHAIKNVASQRTDQERGKMAQAISENGLMGDIMVMLHSMPRIVLLILKTNDLTRYLDELLKSPLGPYRTFLIMATYCAKTVYDEGREKIDEMFGGSWSVERLGYEVNNWFKYFRRQTQLTVYNWLVYLRLV